MSVPIAWPEHSHPFAIVQARSVNDIYYLFSKVIVFVRSIRFAVVITKHYTNLKLFSKFKCEKISHSLNKIEMKMKIIKGEF